MSKCENCKNWCDATAECAYLLMCCSDGRDPDQSAVDAMDNDKCDDNDCSQYK